FLMQKTSGLGTLQQGEMILILRGIREDLFLTAYAAYITELVDRGTEEKKPNPYLLEFILESLKQLNEGTDPDVIIFIV
ncbi:DNA repair protein RecO, partial [Bacillus vallismortis]|nr:DNA repair protein RecO [Bacillus vallismortis]